MSDSLEQPHAYKAVDSITTDKDKAREEFESVFCGDDCEADFSQTETGEYKNESTQCGWIAFEYQQEIIESQRKELEELRKLVGELVQEIDDFLVDYEYEHGDAPNALALRSTNALVAKAKERLK